ncbi:MAG: MFS transporter [Myxococcales bacterium]|nr:MFS transporter [Myxococcales bacterium]
MATGSVSSHTSPMPNHTSAFRLRRFWNWFPMGLAYAFLYMGRYNLTVAKSSLGILMSKEDFGVIFGVGTLVYGVSFLLNGPLTDRIGGRLALLASVLGSAFMNAAMGIYVQNTLSASDPDQNNLRLWLSVMYGVNMYFQSFGAVAIVKVNAHWFHVRERGGFSGIFGTMISSGIFLAFTVNSWILGLVKGPQGVDQTWWVFYVPAALLFAMFVIELLLLRDQPSHAGHGDFDTGDASSGDSVGPTSAWDLYRRILTNPIILTIAAVEFCTGILRQGVMHWFPFYVKEVWTLPRNHWLDAGSWSSFWTVIVAFAASAVFFSLYAWTRRKLQKNRPVLLISGAFLFLAPFVQGGWGGLLFVAGVVGGNIAGWVSDIFFQSRRAPAAGGMYALLAVCVGLMFFGLGSTTNQIDWVDEKAGSGLLVGDTIVGVSDKTGFTDWESVKLAVQCIPATCVDPGAKKQVSETAKWDSQRCMCSSSPKVDGGTLQKSTGVIPLTVLRNGETVTVNLKDKHQFMAAGDVRRLPAGPKLSITPALLGILVVLISLCVIGTHGLLSGTATMDFGGRKAAATAVGFIDGAVYLGTAVQSFALGYLTPLNWTYWPMFMFPFGVAGFLLCLRIWKALPSRQK